MNNPDFRALNPPVVTLTALLCPAYEPGDGSADGAQLVGMQWWHPTMGCDSLQIVVDNARAALAQPEPKRRTPAPDYDRVSEIATEAQIRAAAHYLKKKKNCDGDLIPAIEYAIARWSRPAIEPVPVSERPWEREGWCDAEERCWLCGNVEGDWRLMDPSNTGVPQLKYCFSHSLPHHALPVPEVTP
jgi:hypothetical protein